MKFLDKMVKFNNNNYHTSYINEELNYATNKCTQMTKNTKVFITTQREENSMVGICIRPYYSTDEDTYYTKTRYSFYVPINSELSKSILSQLKVTKDKIVKESYRNRMCYRFIVEDFAYREFGDRHYTKKHHSIVHKYYHKNRYIKILNTLNFIKHNSNFNLLTCYKFQWHEYSLLFNNPSFSYKIHLLGLRAISIDYQNFKEYLDTYQIPKHCIPEQYRHEIPSAYINGRRLPRLLRHLDIYNVLNVIYYNDYYR